MKTPLRVLLIAAPATATLSLSSCVYDPYSYGYGSTGYYGDTMLIATSSSYWGYDPYRYCYFDYRRNCYYDPYLCGYYPVGHCPPPIAGCPHPHGWQPGHGVCPPPHNPGSTVLANYHNRIAQLQATNYAWRSQVHQNQQSQLAHMRANQEAWRNRVQQAQPVTTASQVTRRGTPNPRFAAAAGSLPATGRTVPGAGGATIRSQNVPSGRYQGPAVQGQGVPRFQPGTSGRATRAANLPVNAGQQQAAAQAAMQAQAQAAAQPRVQAPPPPPPPAPVHAARENQRSSSSDQHDRGGRSSRR